jgi:WD40 repeat protein
VNGRDDLAAPGSASLPTSPYRGLSPFGDSDFDALFFFGRERESEVIAANLVAARLTVLYGPTGVGKSSVLRAGVAHRLRNVVGEGLTDGRPTDVAVVVFSSWVDEPVPALLERVTASVGAAVGDQPPPLPPGSSLVDGLAVASRALRGDLYVILDQAEEYFLYRPQNGRPDAFAAEFADAVGRPELRANFLLSIRDDALAQLDMFKSLIPGILSNYLRLDRLDRRAAEAAVVRPLERWTELTGERVEIESALVESVLDGVVTGRVDLGQEARGGVEGPAVSGLIETPFLQLVLERLWAVERSAGSTTLRLSTFEDLGGAENIVRAHLEGAMEALDEEQRDVAANVFNHLVTPSGTKVAHSSTDLAGYAGIEEREIVPVLRTLGQERILRSVESNGDPDESRFEIFHDVLAEPVLAWRATYRAQRERREAERRHRRLVVFAALALIAAAAMAAVTVYALSQRSEARDQARRARAGELAATAAALRGTDPLRAVRTAALAARLQPTPETEEVLREALVAMRLRAILPTGRLGPVRAVVSRDNALVAVAGGGGARVFSARTGRLLRTFEKSGSVLAVAFSRDGRRLLTGDAEGHARLWDAKTGALLATMRHQQAVNDVSFSKDDSTVVTASTDATARLWGTNSGKLVRVLRNNGPVAHAALSPDGRRVVTMSGSDPKTEGAYIFDAVTGRLVANLPQQGITSVRFSPNGKLLATTSLDRTTGIWDGRTGMPLRTLPQPDGHVLASEFSRDGNLLVTASDSAAADIWDVQNGQRLLRLVGATNAAETASFSPDGRYVVVSSLDRAARIYTAKEGFPKSILLGHTEGVTSAAFSRDGSEVVTASDDGTARLWDPGIEDPLRLLGSHHAAVNVASFSPDGRLAVSASDDGTTRIWRVRDHRLLQALAQPGFVRDASFSRDGGIVVSAGSDGTVRLWRVATGRPLHVLRGHQGQVNTAAFSPNGRLLVSGGDDGTARLWQVATGRPLHVLRGHTGPVLRASFSPDGDLLVTAGDDGTARLWQVATGRPLHVLRGHSGPVLRASFSPDGELVATAGDDGTARLWSARTGAAVHILRGHIAAVRDAEFSGDGKLVVTASDDHDARIWSVGTGRSLRVLRGHFNAVLSASFSPDRRWVVTAGPFTAGLWRTSTGRLFSITGLNNDPFLRGHTLPLTSATFSPDGHRILTSSLDGTVRIFTCDVCGSLVDLLALADARLRHIGQGLTPGERGRYLAG